MDLVAAPLPFLSFRRSGLRRPLALGGGSEQLLPLSLAGDELLLDILPDTKSHQDCKHLVRLPNQC